MSCALLSSRAVRTHSADVCVGHAAGLRADELQQLRDSLDADPKGRTLVPFLQTTVVPVPADEPADEQPVGHLYAQHASAAFLQCAGSSAPVTQYLRRDVQPLMQDLLQVSDGCAAPVRGCASSLHVLIG